MFVPRDSETAPTGGVLNFTCHIIHIDGLLNSVATLSAGSACTIRILQRREPKLREGNDPPVVAKQGRGRASLNPGPLGWGAGAALRGPWPSQPPLSLSVPRSSAGWADSDGEPWAAPALRSSLGAALRSCSSWPCIR